MKFDNRVSRRHFLTTGAALAAATPLAATLPAQADTLCPSTPPSADIPALDIEARLDESYRDIYVQFPGDDFSDIEASRAGFNGFIATLPEPPAEVTIEDEFVPGHDGHEIRLRIIRPNNLDGPAPVLFWMHGGGLMLGDAAQDDGINGPLALELGIIVVSVEYRRIPEHPYPTPILDCYYGLLGMAERSERLGIDMSRVAVGGNSAGGGLAAALAIGVRDLGGPEIHFQYLLYPMLDDRNITYSSYAVQDPRVWYRGANLLAWRYYLPDGLAGSEEVPPYAAAARAQDLSNLPPVYLNVGSLDLFLDEIVLYAQRLLQANVPTELHVYPGVFHAAHVFVPDAPPSQRWIADEYSALKRGLKF